MPPGADSPGAGALPPGPSPPPSMFVGAVGSGPVDEGVLLAELVLLLEVLFPEELGVADGVIVKTTADVKVVVERPAPSPTPVVNDVDRMTEGDGVDELEFAGADVVPDAADDEELF